LTARHRLVQLVALTVVVSMPLLGLAGIASAKTKNGVGSPAWCLNHPKKAVSVAKCNSANPGNPGGGGTGGTGGSGGLDPSLTIAPNPLVETGQSEVYAVVEFVDPTAAEQQVSIDSSQMSASCGGTITFSDLQGVPAPATPNATVTPKTSTNQVILTLDNEGNADAVVSGTDCAPGSDIFDGSLLTAPFTTELATLVVDPPNVTTAGVNPAPATEVETGDTPASGDSDVYAVFYVEGDPVYAEQEAEITDPQLESSCQGGWLWEPGNKAFANSGNISGSPGNTGTAPPNLPTTSDDEPFTTIDDDGNAVFVFMGISCAPSSTQTPPGSVAIGDIAFNLVGSHPTYEGTFIVDPPKAGV
jgi:hypothetical protein